MEEMISQIFERYRQSSGQSATDLLQQLRNANPNDACAIQAVIDLNQSIGQIFVEIPTEEWQKDILFDLNELNINLETNAIGWDIPLSDNMSGLPTEDQVNQILHDASQPNFEGLTFRTIIGDTSQDLQ